ncbi:kinase-like domain-containing protein [Xylaria sp. FL0933]|nr:kinase-like domain-containing protein [Xylaria sp. FL0933]
MSVGKSRVRVPTASVSSYHRRAFSYDGLNAYACDVDAEWIYRYQPGGYHPVRLGDQLKDGRYKIFLIKSQRYVAIKICLSKAENSRETGVLRFISSLPNETHPGREHIIQLLDSFYTEGPNGRHECLVLELLGPSIPTAAYSHFRDYRLPAQAARSIAHQVSVGVDFLGKLNICHGDIHAQNIVLAMPNLDSLKESEFIDTLGQPEISMIRRKDGSDVGIHVPPYAVQPTTFKKEDVLQSLRTPVAKIVDFGESFLAHQAPATLNTTSYSRPPEVLFNDTLDHRVDLWSLGCLFFELFTGQPTMIPPDLLISKYIPFSSEELPGRWQEKLQSLKDGLPDVADSPMGLQQWLEEVYFLPERHPEFTQQDIAKIGELVRRLLRLEPSLRSSAKDIANDPWFREFV